MANPKIKRGNDRKVRSKSATKLVRQTTHISGNAVIPRAGYATRMRSIPTSPIQYIRNRIELIVDVGTNFPLLPIIDERDDFDGMFKVGNLNSGVVESRYFNLFMGLNVLGKFSLSKLMKINFLNPNNEKLIPWERGLIALQQATLYLPTSEQNTARPMECTLGYKHSDEIAPDCAHIETVEAGSGKIPYAKISIPTLKWCRLNKFNDLVIKPTFKLSIEFDRPFKHWKTDVPSDYGDYFTCGYLEVTMAYRYDNIFYAPDSTLMDFTYPTRDTVTQKIVAFDEMVKKMLHLSSK